MLTNSIFGYILLAESMALELDVSDEQLDVEVAKILMPIGVDVLKEQLLELYSSQIYNKSQYP